MSKATNCMKVRGKDVAARYLVGKGYDIIARDWVCDGGSIDIVARDGRVLVFASVEIGDEPDASLAISSPEKRSITASLMLAFAARYEVGDDPTRYDEIVIVPDLPNQMATIRHHINALSLD